MPPDDVTIRPLIAADVADFRALRLAALADAPEAFTAGVEEEQVLSDQEMLARAVPQPPSVFLGAFHGAELIGIAGYIANQRPKTRHKATMVAVYVRREWRSAKVGLRLVRAIIDHAAAQRAVLLCTVRIDNAPARRLYRQLGFAAYGVEKNAMCVDGRFFDDELLALDLRQGGPDGAS